MTPDKRACGKFGQRSRLTRRVLPELLPTTDIEYWLTLIQRIGPEKRAYRHKLPTCRQTRKLATNSGQFRFARQPFGFRVK